MTVEVGEKDAVVKGKVWERGKPEPEKWTIEFKDPMPNRERRRRPCTATSRTPRRTARVGGVFRQRGDHAEREEVMSYSCLTSSERPTRQSPPAQSGRRCRAIIESSKDLDMCMLSFASSHRRCYCSRALPPPWSSPTSTRSRDRQVVADEPPAAGAATATTPCSAARPAATSST